jgi:pimeloyl-ACP methyl ester carboxylesterase
MFGRMIERGLSCLGPHGFYRMAYVEWGEARGRTTVCVHGLTRNGRDFDALAAALADDGHVVCPDMPGRGKSAFLAQAEDYSYPTYLGAIAALLARLDAAEIDWIGTSMGGIIGMAMAAMPKAPIRRLVVNDVGPLVPKPALERIAAYVGLDPSFPDLAALEAGLRVIHAPFGPLDDAQWHRLASHSARRKPDGSWGLAYDPKIAAVFKIGPIVEVDLWPLWDAIRCPVLALRGALSDLLSAEVAAAMTQRGPRASLIEFPGIGHAPALMASDQIAAIRDFLLA